MTNLTTKIARSLHAEWCRQMWKKGLHGPNQPCITHSPSIKELCEEGGRHCAYFRADLIPWPDLPESSRQEYLATATAVLPEIVELGPLVNALKWAVGELSDRGYSENTPKHECGYIRNPEGAYCEFCEMWVNALDALDLRDRRLEELEK